MLSIGNSIFICSIFTIYFTTKLHEYLFIFQKTADILKNDNLKRELPLALRDSIELNILQEHEK